ncbi:SCP2 sterol-binding domain-containing protein [Saccharospirillum impatiens]|jgi:hypothetical protein|uniref:SCP2 sterol-binding domain-containing protein n=1 Tax=Saccharospirillum impatiens TaxID=169438 RepID=UPI0003F77BBD|nr:SCP2 sterol-binding domain-containing protein [Saccharospirillum impatiens]
MKYRILLWLMALRFKRAIRRQPAFREALQDIDRTIQFTTDERKVSRYLAFRDQRLKSRRGQAEHADITLRFTTASEGFSTLWAMATGKDRNAVMKAIQDKRLAVEGDPMLLMWFQKTVKFLR